MYGLNLYLHSIQLSNDLVRPNDKIRVSITTIPEKIKQAFIIDAKKINDIHHVFSVNITDQTSRIIFVIRRKNFIQNDPIISSTIINANQFPKFNKESAKTEIKFINLYEYIRNQQNINKDDVDRRIIGLMKINFSVTEKFLKMTNQDFGNTQELMFSKLNFFNNNKNKKQNDKNLIFSIMLVEEN